jgi:hypothetical protein
VASQRAREERTLSITSWTVLNNGSTVLETEVAVREAMSTLGAMRAEARQWGWTAKDAGTNGLAVGAQRTPWYLSLRGAEIREGAPKILDSHIICLGFGEVWLPFAVSAPSAVK